jgi:uncharacterized membrane protein
MKNKIVNQLIILSIIFLILDITYISLLGNVFKKQVFDVQNKPLKVNYTSAILCYLLLIIGLYYFIVKSNKSLTEAFLLGIFVYGVYELTTKALLSSWKWQTVIIDTMWGGILFLSSVYILRKIST